MEFENEDGTYEEDIFDGIDGDTDAVGAAFVRGESLANDEMVNDWINDGD